MSSWPLPHVATRRPSKGHALLGSLDSKQYGVQWHSKRSVAWHVREFKCIIRTTVCVHICLYIFIYIHTSVYVYMYTCIYVYMYVYTVRIPLPTYRHTPLHACMHACICACVCVYIYICLHTHTRRVSYVGWYVGMSACVYIGIYVYRYADT